MATNQEVMSDRAFYAFAHPLQRSRFYLALIFSVTLFPIVAAGLIAGTIFLVVPLVAFFLWIGSRTFFAYLMGNSILVSKANYPRIDSIAEELKEKMRYRKPVYIFVYEQGHFNAYLAQHFFRRAIFLNSEILETGVSDDEVRWLVGRFVGYMRARRQAGALGWVIRAARYLAIFNFFILPYERAMVYTGDRLAVAAIDGDISSAISAMQKLLVGRQLGYSVSPEGLIEQHRRVKGSIFAFLARLPSSYPHTTSRYVDLIVFAKAYFPAQFVRFEASNPGLPADISNLAASTKSSLAPPPEKLESAGNPPHGWACAIVTLALLSGFAYAGWNRIVLNIGNVMHRHDDEVPASLTETNTPTPPAAASAAAAPTETQTTTTDENIRLVENILQAATADNWNDVDQQTQSTKSTAAPHGNRKQSRAANDEGLRAFREQNYAGAIRAFSLGIQADPSDIEVRNNLGFAYLEAGDVQTALNVLTNVLVAAPNRSAAWANMAEAFAQSDNPEFADASVKLAIHYSTNRAVTADYFGNIADTRSAEKFGESVARVLKDIDNIP